MSRASEAYSALMLAMDEIAPACTNDARFIVDDQSTDELAPICLSCPLLEICGTYANIERPKAGIWAGKRYRTNQPRRAGGAA